jgi:hypothetical protein
VPSDRAAITPACSLWRALGQVVGDEASAHSRRLAVDLELTRTALNLMTSDVYG